MSGITSQNCTTLLKANIWSIVQGTGNSTIYTQIVLPGGHTVTLNNSNANDSGNCSTGHYALCP